MVSVNHSWLAGGLGTGLSRLPNSRSTFASSGKLMHFSGGAAPCKIKMKKINEIKSNVLGSDSGSFCAVYPTSSSAFFPFFFYYELSHCGKNPLPSWSVQNHCVSSRLVLEIEARGWVGVRGGCAVGVTQGHAKPSTVFHIFTFDVGQPDFVAFFFNTPKRDDSSSETTKRT